jgi:hypothetical protein
MASNSPRWHTVLCVLAAIVTLWIAAFAAETAARISHQALMRLGSDLPAVTAMMISAVKSFVPWMLAMVGTVALTWLVARASPCVLHGCVLAAIIAALMSALTALAFAMPFSLCGVLWPDWVATARDVLGAAGSKAVSCR